MQRIPNPLQLTPFPESRDLETNWKKKKIQNKTDRSISIPFVISEYVKAVEKVEKKKFRCCDDVKN